MFFVVWGAVATQSLEEPLYDRSVLAKAVRFLLAKVQILTKYTMCHFVQNDKIQVLLPVPCSLFPVPCSRLPCRPGTNVSPYEKMASPKRDNHFVSVIHKGLLVPIDKILRKRGSGWQNPGPVPCFLFPDPCSRLPHILRLLTKLRIVVHMTNTQISKARFNQNCTSPGSYVIISA